MRSSTRIVTVVVALIYVKFIVYFLEEGRHARAAKNNITYCKYGGTNGQPFNSTCFLSHHSISFRLHEADFPVLFHFELGPFYYRANVDHVAISATLAGIAAVMVQPGGTRLFVACENAIFLGLLELSQTNNPIRSVNWNDWNNFLIGVALANVIVTLFEASISYLSMALIGTGAVLL